MLSLKVGSGVAITNHITLVKLLFSFLLQVKIHDHPRVTAPPFKVNFEWLVYSIP